MVVTTNPGTGALSPDTAWAELLAIAANGAGPDDDRRAELVRLLQHDADPRFVELALPLLADPAPTYRTLAAALLSRFGRSSGREVGGRTAPLLAAAARIEVDDEVRSELVSALARAGGESWAPEVSGYATDHAAEVRLVVAQELGLMFLGDPDATGAAALLSLTRDADPRVRNWATFSLGTLTDLDSPALREALADRLDDEDDEAAEEALVGLARRGDARARDDLLHRLDFPAEEIYLLELRAAAALADPVLLPLLRAVAAESGPDDDPMWTRELRFALARCDESAATEAELIEREIVAARNHEGRREGRSVRTEGRYPHTWVVVLRADGVPDPDEPPSRLWDDETPQSILITQQVGTSWGYAENWS